jgi:glycosyltransferase involved in cell wall biosynthesis
MNIVQVLASNKLGGAERFFCRLAKSFADQKLNQTVMLRDNGPYVKTLNQLNHILAPFTGSLDFSTKKQLNRLIQQQSPNIVMTWMNRASQITSKLYKSKHYQHVARLGGYYNLKYYQHCDHFVGNTKDICDYLIKSGITKERVHYISNFADEKQGTPLQRPQDRPLLIALGRLHTNKAFDTLIKAMTEIKDAELWIGGTGPLENELKQLIEQLQLNDRVKLLGWIDRPEDLIATGDIFICPSRHEPLGNVILEAWAQHKPVISTRNQGALENITDEQNGLLAPIDNPKALAIKINKLIQDQSLCHQLSTQGFSTYSKHFSKDVITKQYIDLFNQISSHSPP